MFIYVYLYITNVSNPKLLLLFCFCFLCVLERASKLIEECEGISSDTLGDLTKLPPREKPNARTLAKYLRLCTLNNPSIESTADDCLFMLLHMVGFNEGNFVVRYDIEY